MNRKEMIAHLVLHGWEPMACTQAWRGVMNAANTLVHVRIDSMVTGPQYVDVAARFIVATSKDDCRSEWKKVPTKILRDCYQHIMENKL